MRIGVGAGVHDRNGLTTRIELRGSFRQVTITDLNTDAGVKSSLSHIPTYQLAANKNQGRASGGRFPMTTMTMMGGGTHRDADSFTSGRGQEVTLGPTHMR